MNELTKKEYDRLMKYIDIIKIIVVNHSCSDIPISFRETVADIATKHKIQYCKNCNVGLYNAVSRLYTLIFEYNKKISEKNDINKGKQN